MCGPQANKGPRKHQMIIQNRELEELQARIREAEERLKSRSSVIGGARSSDAQANGGYQSTGERYPYLRIAAISYLTDCFHDRIRISDNVPNGHGRPVLER